MGDVTFFLNNSNSGSVGDDEEYGNEASGSGDGESTYVPFYKTTDRSTLHKSANGAHDDDKFLIYVIAASFALAVVIIIIVVTIICCRRHAKAQRARKKFELNQSMGMTVNMDNSRMLTRLLPPPPFTEAPPPPDTTTSKMSRVAPEAEKLLKATSSESNKTSSMKTDTGKSQQNETVQLSQYEVPIFPHHYEEVDDAGKKTKADQTDSVNIGTGKHPKSDKDQGSGHTSRHSSEAKEKHYPVAKPRKSVENLDITNESSPGHEKHVQV